MRALPHPHPPNFPLRVNLVPIEGHFLSCGRFDSHPCRGWRGSPSILAPGPRGPQQASFQLWVLFRHLYNEALERHTLLYVRAGIGGFRRVLWLL